MGAMEKVKASFTPLAPQRELKDRNGKHTEPVWIYSPELTRDSEVIPSLSCPTAGARGTACASAVQAFELRAMTLPQTTDFHQIMQLRGKNPVPSAVAPQENNLGGGIRPVCDNLLECPLLPVVSSAGWEDGSDDEGSEHTLHKCVFVSGKHPFCFPAASQSVSSPEAVWVRRVRNERVWIQSSGCHWRNF